ncbi:MAG TPA: YifB family Mg chelatase-like AAA ATPase [Candidatus Andersenbacteria bacterium]|nr:YifB family Mg chelatase-like AAA ATPase [Candidatus Andersenbacteria bacterium]
MPAHIQSAAVFGIDAISVDVEVDVLQGLPSFTLVGLTDKAIQESRERMTAALTNSGYTPPRRKTIVSLAPASLKKEGSLYDVPIAIGFLCASEQIIVREDVLNNAWFVGELGLDGSIRFVHGVLPIALAAIRSGVKRLYVPFGNAKEVAEIADQIQIYPVGSLTELVLCLVEDATAPFQAVAWGFGEESELDKTKPEIDMNEIRGQEHAKRALVICAAGGHNGLLIGPPGTGKTLLARAMVGILPQLSREESFTVTSIYSIAGLLHASDGLMKRRPFRSPHHGASSAALVGGGTMPKPGEVTLAHHGVLFLDELPEFPRTVLEQLRAPIEDGMVTVSRAAHTVRFPARTMLVAAMNPCPCGFVGSQRKSCSCSANDISRYQRRISGPMLDRFDLHVLVNDVPAEELLSTQRSGASSKEYADIVLQAREKQWARQGKVNAELKPSELMQYCVIDQDSRSLLIKAQNRFRLSSRGIHRLLKVALTIADISQSDKIETNHLAEALQYREQLATALPDFA